MTTCLPARYGIQTMSRRSRLHFSYMPRSVRHFTALAGLLAVSLSQAASVQQQDFAAAARLRPDTTRGERLFAACAACHGTDGAGNAANDVPALAGQHARVVMRQFIKYRYGMRWDIRMERVAEVHMLEGPQALADVAGYVAALPAQPARASGSGQRLGHGAQLYREHCLSCHGRSAEGSNADEVPRLAGQHYSWLVRQMHDLVEGRRPDAAGQHLPLLKSFEAADFLDVADYLARGANGRTDPWHPLKR